MTAAPPNILFITTDQQRADCLGSAGHPVVRTPHLDQLAYEGVRFSAAYADCPVCIPSRCTMISGRYAFSYGRPRYFSHEPFPIDRSQTLMACLTRAGYQTQAVGKMHFYPERARYGFEHMVLDYDYPEWLAERAPEYAGLAFTGHGVGLNEVWPTLSAVPAHLTSTAWTVSESIRFLKKRDPERPFFLWTSFFKPHPPFDPPEPYYSMYNAAPIAEPAVGDWTDDPPFALRYHRESHKYDLIPPEAVRQARACYYGLITEIDHQLGRLFGAMRQLGVMDDTLILFTSDHGDMLGDHRDFGKATLYDGSARVPFLLRWPRGVSPDTQGTVCAAPVGLADVMPTLVEAAGGAVPDGIDGRSVLPLARGERADWREFVPGEMGTSEGQFSLTDGQEKYLWFRWEGREQLFDLETDPAECTDLSGQLPERAALWRQRLVQHLAERRHEATDGRALLPVGMPYPSARQVRARNSQGWNDNRPAM